MISYDESDNDETQIIKQKHNHSTKTENNRDTILFESDTVKLYSSFTEEIRTY